MLASRPVVPKTPHAKLRNENQFSTTNRAFPKTPLPQQLKDTFQTGKHATVELTTQPRKGLADKTPGTHLQNRGTRITLRDPSGKDFVTLDEKPPSASRKSTKKPRVSQEFKTPDPATRKPYWDVSDTSIVEQVALPDPVMEVEKEEGDFDEVEYMPPRAERMYLSDLTDGEFKLRPRVMGGGTALPIDQEYGLPSGAELGRKLMEIATTPYHCYYDAPPPSFDHEAFFIPEEHLVVPLRPLSPDTDDDGLAMPVDPNPLPTRSTRARSRARAAAAVPTRSSSRLAKASAASSNKPTLTTKAPAKRARAATKSSTVPKTTAATRGGKGKGKEQVAPTVAEFADDTIPELLEVFQRNELAIDDFRLEISSDDDDEDDV